MTEGFLRRGALPLVGIVCLAASASFGHGGGLDYCGGHHDRIHGGYHIHDESILRECSRESVREIRVTVYNISAGDPVEATLKLYNTRLTDYKEVHVTCQVLASGSRVPNIETFDAGRLGAKDERRFEIPLDAYGEQGHRVKCWVRKATAE